MDRQIRGWYDFTGKVFVVTGGSGALGSELVRALVGCGADVAVLGRSTQRAQPLLDELGSDHLAAIAADVLDRESLEAAAAAVQERFGPLYGLVNAAGGNHPRATSTPDLSFFDLPEDALRHVLDLNLLGTLLPCQILGKGMAERGEGVIVNFSSMNYYRPLTRVVAYSVAKAGVSNLTQWLAVHMAKNYGPAIRVNAIAPGFFLGEQNRYLLTEEGTGALTARGQTIIDHTPMGRFGEPSDLTGTLLWLLSPASAFVTGITVPVDGGFSSFGGV
ncbi:MAG: SDR family oxidoreductase [Anaerolineae bacterium]|jgi:NAD(P)-dependent dehydrogenase (short-subunit alcohol dehydrogenase family)|nr:SDR family oxidoreductase [Chloroflexota bacterium]